MTPKQRLLASDPIRKDIAAIINSTNFETALEAALWEFVWGQPRGGVEPGSTAIGAHFELAGAKRFIEILRQITDKEPERVPGVPGQLNYDAMNPTRENKKDK